MIKDQVVSLQSQVEQLQGEISSLVDQNRQLASQLSNPDDVVAPLKDEMATLRRMFDNLEKKTTDLAQTARAPSPLGRRDKSAQKPDVPELNEIKRSLKKVENQVANLQARERQALSRGQTEVQVPAVGQGNSGKDAAAMERCVSRIEHQQTLSDVQMAEHDEKISVLETASYDGSYIWKIQELERHIQETVNGKTLSIYSPPFYVGRFGYKVCARVDFDVFSGENAVRLSFFFVVMRGAYDAILPWPFQQQVTYKLFHQDGDRHLMDSFHPDPNSSSFQRPRNNINIGHRCFLSLEQSELYQQGFIKDDTLFLKLSVNLAIRSATSNVIAQVIGNSVIDRILFSSGINYLL